MKSSLLAALLLPVVFAQPALDCSRARYCQMREQTASASGHFSVEGLHNGSVTVRGTKRNDVLVRMRVEADAHSEREAKDLFGRIHTHVTPGRFTVDGPGQPDNLFSWFFDTGWSVSVEVMVPNQTDLKLVTHNGAIRADEIAGRVQAESHNGGIRLDNVTGDVRFESHNGSVVVTRAGGSVEGSSHNGGIEIDVTGTSTSTRAVRAESHNGGVNLALPATFNAHVSTNTDNGGVRSDFPMPPNRRGEARREFDLGSGGGSVRISTHNGGIRLRKT